MMMGLEWTKSDTNGLLAQSAHSSHHNVRYAIVRVQVRAKLLKAREEEVSAIMVRDRTDALSCCLGTWNLLSCFLGTYSLLSCFLATWRCLWSCGQGACSQRYTRPPVL